MKKTNPRKLKPQTHSNQRFSKNILLYVFLFLLPFQIGKHFFFDFSYVSAVRIDYLAPTLYLTDIFAVVLIIFYIKKLLPLVHNKFLLIFLGLLAINILFSASPPLAIYKSIKILEVIFLITIYYYKKKSLAPKSILGAVFFAGLIEFFLAGLQLFYKHSIQGVFYFLGERFFSLSTPDIAKASLQGIEFLRPYGTFSHPNSLAGFYLLLHTFVLTYRPFDKYPLLKYSFLGLSSLLVLLTFSKIAILGFFLVTFIYTITHEKELKCKFCMASRIVVAGILTVIFSIAQGDPLSAANRLELAQSSLQIIRSHLLIGVGLGNYLLAQSKFTIKTPYFFLQPVHNIILLIVSEIGIIFSGYLFYLIWKVRRIFVDNQCLTYCVGIILFTGMFDHYWLTLQQNLLLLSIIFSLSVGTLKSSNRG